MNSSDVAASSSAGSLAVFRRVRLPAERRPQLFVVVDTEEEFDWTAGYSRAHTSVTAMKHVHRGQAIFDRFGIRPAYVIDFPVAAQRDGYAPLLEIAADRRCQIGAHLHPWVNPPYDETVNVRNSFTMNLPPALQRSKLRVLCDAIGEQFGAHPRVFKAGRYGLGGVTAALLEEMGFDTDTSVSPRLDFSSEGGPDFRAFDAGPFFLTPRLLEVPCTIEFTGWAGRWRQPLQAWAARTSIGPVGAAGVLARLGMVNRIMLSPEGNTFEEMRQLTLALVERGERTFTFSFHSPSLAPGHTPYVRSADDLSAFLRTIERYCEFFTTELNGEPATLSGFRAAASEFVSGV